MRTDVSETTVQSTVQNCSHLKPICKELLNIFFNLDYDFILNISEDGWFNRSIGTFQHFSHSIFRSIEEG